MSMAMLPMTYVRHEGSVLYAADNLGRTFSIDTDLWPEWDEVPFRGSLRCAHCGEDRAGHLSVVMDEHIVPVAKMILDFLPWTEVPSG